MTELYRHPFIKQSWEVSQLIELCGASTNLTNAVVASSKLTRDLHDYFGRQENTYFAWLIEPKSNASANELQFYGIDLAGHEGWQNTVVFAYKFATKDEALRVAAAKGFNDVNIVEHGWGP